MGARALVVFHPPCEGNCPHFPGASDILTYRRMYPIYYDCNARVTTDIIPDDVLLFLFLASFLFFFFVVVFGRLRSSVGLYDIRVYASLSFLQYTHGTILYTTTTTTITNTTLLLYYHYYYQSCGVVTLPARRTPGACALPRIIDFYHLWNTRAHARIYLARRCCSCCCCWNGRLYIIITPLLCCCRYYIILYIYFFSVYWTTEKASFFFFFFSVYTYMQNARKSISRRVFFFAFGQLCGSWCILKKRKKKKNRSLKVYIVQLEHI